MQKLFVDCDASLDMLLKREPFAIYSAKLHALAEEGKLKLYSSPVAFANINYILTSVLNRNKASQLLNKYRMLVDVLVANEKIVDLALNSSFKDFEDALQYYSALEGKISGIITRNKKDYQGIAIPALTPKEFLASF